MPKKTPTQFRASPRALWQLARLREWWGVNLTAAIETCIDRTYQQEALGRMLGPDGEQTIAELLKHVDQNKIGPRERKYLESRPGVAEEEVE